MPFQIHTPVDVGGYVDGVGGPSEATDQQGNLPDSACSDRVDRSSPHSRCDIQISYTGCGLGCGRRNRSGRGLVLQVSERPEVVRSVKEVFGPRELQPVGSFSGSSSAKPDPPTQAVPNGQDASV